MSAGGVDPIPSSRAEHTTQAGRAESLGRGAVFRGLTGTESRSLEFKVREGPQLQGGSPDRTLAWSRRCPWEKLLSAGPTREGLQERGDPDGLGETKSVARVGPFGVWPCLKPGLPFGLLLREPKKSPSFAEAALTQLCGPCRTKMP